MTRNSANHERRFKRLMLRSAFQSLFWNVLLERKKKQEMNLTSLANSLGVDKAYVSRSFSSPPNWQIDKISDFADVLGIEIEVVARDNLTGELFAPFGSIEFAKTSTESGKNVSLINSDSNSVTHTATSPCLLEIVSA